MIHSKKEDKSSVTTCKETQISDLLEKYFKTTILNMLIELNENRDGQLNKIRKIIYKQNENINEIEIIKKNHTEILEMKNTITELKNLL